jgi:hypothetical protein
LTPKGMDVYRQIVPLVQEVEAEMLAALSADDRVGLDNALARIEAYLDRTAPAPGAARKSNAATGNGAQGDAEEAAEHA